jgi:hypothetical protein
VLPRLFLISCLIPALCSAQAPDSVGNQKVLAELKDMQASLKGLLQLMETIEKGQKSQLTLTRIQIDEYRVATLEAQRLQLLARERELTREVAASPPAARTEESGGQMLPTSPTGPPDAGGRSSASPSSVRLAQSSRTLEEVRRNRQIVEQQIAVIRARIDKMERSLE